jgi:hypothetical protein
MQKFAIRSAVTTKGTRTFKVLPAMFDLLVASAIAKRDAAESRT